MKAPWMALTSCPRWWLGLAKDHALNATNGVRDAKQAETALSSRLSVFRPEYHKGIKIGQRATTATVEHWQDNAETQEYIRILTSRISGELIIARQCRYGGAWLPPWLHPNQHPPMAGVYRILKAAMTPNDRGNHIFTPAYLKVWFRCWQAMRVCVQRVSATAKSPQDYRKAITPEKTGILSVRGF